MKDFTDFTQFAYSIRDEALFEDFMMGITTDKERQELVRRVKVVQRLLDGQPQAKIASDLGVGVATVTRGSKELANGRFKALREQS